MTDISRVPPSAGTGTRKKICCYARVRDKGFFDTHDFYRVDIQILRQLGHEVVVTNSVRTMLTTSCDLYYAWWFGYGIFPALWARIRRKPVIVSGVLHTLNCEGLAGWPGIKRAIMKLTMKLADCSILCSPTEYKRLDGFRPRRCEVIPLSIDTHEYRADPARAREKLILMMTQLSLENVQRKMVLPALEAFAGFSTSHPDFKMVVCGAPGDGIELVRDQVRKFKLEDKITFAGRVSLQEKISLLQTAWAYLQPTSCEGFGLAIGEALACGAPVVTSPEVCVMDIYGDAAQYCSTVDEMAQALSRLAQDDDYRRTMQGRGMSHVQKYSLAGRRRHYQELIEQLCP